MPSAKRKGPRVRRKVPIEIGGRDLYLHFTVNRIAELEDALGRPFAEVFGGEDGGIGFREIRAGLYYGLQESWGNTKPALTFNMVGNWIDDDMERLPELAKALGEAMAVWAGADPAEVAEKAPEVVPVETPFGAAASSVAAV